jgi:hypothetical protein
MFFFSSYFRFTFVFNMFRIFLSLLTTLLIATRYTVLSLLTTHFYRNSLHSVIATDYTNFDSYASQKSGLWTSFWCVNYNTPEKVFKFQTRSNYFSLGHQNKNYRSEAILVFLVGILWIRFCFYQKSITIFFLVYKKTRLPENRNTRYENFNGHRL